MRRATRTFLAWILILAMPIHGFAAASMIVCGPNHARMAEAAEAASHDHGGGAQSGAGHHHHAAAPSAHDPADDPESLFVKILKLKCSACESCCAMSAVPVAALPSLSFVPSLGVTAPFFDSSNAAIVPDGLERPPSAVLA